MPQAVQVAAVLRRERVAAAAAPERTVQGSHSRHDNVTNADT